MYTSSLPISTEIIWPLASKFISGAVELRVGNEMDIRGAHTPILILSTSLLVGRKLCSCSPFWTSRGQVLFRLLVKVFLHRCTRTFANGASICSKLSLSVVDEDYSFDLILTVGPTG